MISVSSTTKDKNEQKNKHSTTQSAVINARRRREISTHFLDRELWQEL